jgi:hypothetical protein
LLLKATYIGERERQKSELFSHCCTTDQLLWTIEQQLRTFTTGTDILVLPGYRRLSHLGEELYIMIPNMFRYCLEAQTLRDAFQGCFLSA